MTKQELKDSIASVVKANGENEITGANLQTKLFEIVDECYGGSDSYPDGVVMVNASRDFEATDANKILFCTAPNIELTMPAISPFAVLDKFYIYPNVNTKYTIVNGSDFIEMFTSPVGQGELTELLFTGESLTSMNGFIVEGSNSKSTLKYLYDRVNALGSSILLNGGATVAVTFATSKYYGSVASPVSGGSITYDFTNAVAGSKAIIFHNAGTEPTYPVGTYKRFGTYQPSLLNILTFEYIDSNTILLDISYSTTVGLQPEVVTWLNNGGIATGFILTALNKLIIDILPVRSKILRWNLFTGETFASSMIPIINNLDRSNIHLGSSALDFSINFTSTQFGVVGPFGGLNGFTTAKYVDTGFNPTSVSQFGLDDSGIGICWWGGILTGAPIMGAGNLLKLSYTNGGGSGQVQVINTITSFNVASAGVAGAKSYMFLTRTDSNQSAHYINGSKTLNAVASTSKPNQNILIFTSDGTNYPLQNSNTGSCGGYIITKGITNSDESIIRGAWATFNATLARG